MKFNARKNLLSLAVASAISGGALIVAAPAHAMNVSQDNIGQVLLYPYYTVKNGFDTVFTVTNTSDRTAVFKIRFREALNSREVRDFNVILSPYDHWSGAVTMDAAGTGALIRTFDKTCTSPILPDSSSVAGAKEVAFTNELFSGNFVDGGTTDMTRVQEGYFEIILMGVSTRDTAVSTNLVEYNAKHVSGVPRSCSIVDTQFLASNINTQLKNVFLPPENILKGHVTLINVASGKAIDAEPTAIEDFMLSDEIIAPPGTQDPSLASGDPMLVNSGYALQDGNHLTFSTGDPTVGSENTVSELLRASSVINEFATGVGASTSWVVTFPTKHFFTDSYTDLTGPTVANGTPGDGFSEWFYTTSGSPAVAVDGKSCDNITMDMVNREEGRIQTVDTTQFSPYNPSSPTVSLCYEANVIDFNGTSVFGSGVNRLGVSTSGVGSAGWANLFFSESDATSIGGLPVIGFSAIMRDGANASVNYGSSTEHTYKHTGPF
jgi:hypothetical protein